MQANIPGTLQMPLQLGVMPLVLNVLLHPATPVQHDFYWVMIFWQSCRTLGTR